MFTCDCYRLSIKLKKVCVSDCYRLSIKLTCLQKWLLQITNKIKKVKMFT